MQLHILTSSPQYVPLWGCGAARSNGSNTNTNTHTASAQLNPLLREKQMNVFRCLRLEIDAFSENCILFPCLSLRKVAAGKSVTRSVWHVQQNC